MVRAAVNTSNKTSASPTWREHTLASGALQAQALAHSVAAQLQAALNVRGTASLLVSGGRSPVAFFTSLRQTELDWQRVHVSLVDERGVAPSDPASNAALVREHLLVDRAAGARFTPWVSAADLAQGQPAPDDWCALVQARLQAQFPPPPWDLAVLGMGEDGHTASWFANSPGLETALHSSDWVRWVQPRQAAHLRLTLTRHALLSCRYLHLALSGANKYAQYQRARTGPNPALPVSLVLHAAPNLDVWIAEPTS